MQLGQKLDHLILSRGIGAGDVVVASVTGIKFGTSLLWAVVFTVALKFVVTEALACGTPVVVTDVGGVREIVLTATAGRIVPQRTAPALGGACPGPATVGPSPRGQVDQRDGHTIVQKQAGQPAR